MVMELDNFVSGLSIVSTNTTFARGILQLLDDDNK